ncbi:MULTISPECIES: hypothetical protein [Myxococcus]|uniref:Uncharacterized protein n=1 Tax=Myxococcus virescens TaxID=83456 RepID=A0A511HQ90_9BACT|nr:MULTISPECIES: hypothetical protein [Myxococcus]QDE83353.1 hypothetical protein BHS07_18295 [Myxococcus xanthus]GEL75753.1 hypothetical protein MVI01_75370 [Myxococcus virescens]SDD65890.1 hypothetical protein SAMN04488504_102161 [Myxococcus virescens]
MRLHIAALLVCLLSTSTAHAMDVAPSLHPHEVKALKADASKALQSLLDKHGEKAGIKPGEGLSREGVRCALYNLSHIVMVKMSALAKDPAQKTRFAQAAEFYNRLSLQHCDSKGGPPNQGLVLMLVAGQEEAKSKQSMNKVKEADLWDDFKEAAGKVFGGQKIGPREVAIIVAVGTLVLAKEAIPLPL